MIGDEEKDENYARKGYIRHGMTYHRAGLKLIICELANFGKLLRRFIPPHDTAQPIKGSFGIIVSASFRA